jgi:cobalamin biosynthesis Mg chelatase CobN
MKGKIVIISMLFMMLLFCNVAMAVAPTLSNKSPSDTSKMWDMETTSISVDINCTSGTFDWNITTSPDIGNSGATGASNGTKSCSISGLEYSTEYTWYVNSTNGTLWTNASYTFTTRDAKLRENSALSGVEKAIVGAIGVIILMGIIYILLKMDYTKDGQLAKILIGVLLALIFISIIYSAL